HSGGLAPGRNRRPDRAGGDFGPGSDRALTQGSRRPVPLDWVSGGVGKNCSMPPAANTPTTAPDLFGPLLLLIVEAGVSLALAVAVFVALWFRGLRPRVSSLRRL